jgi:zinc transport system permease protein
MNFFNDLFDYSFLSYALIAILLSSIICGIIGSFVVVKKISHIAGGISHTVLGGMGVAVFFGYQAQLGALISAIISALLIAWVSIKSQEQENTFINALWAIGMAIGILFLHLTPGYNSHLVHFLFGNILMITSQELIFLSVLNGIVIASVLLFYKQLQAICFDPEYATLKGIHSNLFYLFLLILIAITVVILVQIVGIILVIALLCLPSAISLFFFQTLKRVIFSSISIGILSGVSGLFLSYQLDTPAGATIIILLGFIYFISFCFQFTKK